MVLRLNFHYETFFIIRIYRPYFSFGDYLMSNTQSALVKTAEHGNITHALKTKEQDPVSKTLHSLQHLNGGWKRPAGDRMELIECMKSGRLSSFCFQVEVKREFWTTQSRLGNWRSPCTSTMILSWTGLAQPIREWCLSSTISHQTQAQTTWNSHRGNPGNARWWGVQRSEWRFEGLYIIVSKWCFKGLSALQLKARNKSWMVLVINNLASKTGPSNLKPSPWQFRECKMIRCAKVWMAFEGL